MATEAGRAPSSEHRGPDLRFRRRRDRRLTAPLAGPYHFGCNPLSGGGEGCLDGVPPPDNRRAGDCLANGRTAWPVLGGRRHVRRLSHLRAWWARTLRTEQRAKSQCELPSSGRATARPPGGSYGIQPDNRPDQKDRMGVGPPRSLQTDEDLALRGGFGISTESLILAQDERWRRA